MLDSPEGVCPGQARFEYPATSVLFSNFDPTGDKIRKDDDKLRKDFDVASPAVARPVSQGFTTDQIPTPSGETGRRSFIKLYERPEAGLPGP